MKVGTTEGETVLALNNGRKPFSDVRVRRALAHAVNRQDVIDGALFGYGTPIGSHFAPHRAGYVDLTGLYPYDPSRAKDLLAQAGYPNGFDAVIRLPPPVYARRGGEIIAAQLAEVGVRLRIEPMEWAPWLEQVFQGRDYDMTIISHVEPLDIDIYNRPRLLLQLSQRPLRRRDGRVEPDASSRTGGRRCTAMPSRSSRRTASTSSCSSFPRPASSAPA